MRVKICGLSTIEHALAAAEAGADFVGLVFAASRRRVELAQARAIADAVRSSGRSFTTVKDNSLRGERPLLVGVFEGQDAAEINATAASVGLDYVQLQDPPPRLCGRIAWPVIVGCGVSRDTDPNSVVERLWQVRAQRLDALLLLDTVVGGRTGGSGVPFNWSIARHVAHYFPIFLAGGLTPENVGDAIRLVRPAGVDVSSGVETDGVKDAAKIAAFVAAARAADGAGAA